MAYISTSLLFLAPLLVTLALKVNSLVGIEQAPNSLAVVTGTGALLAMVGNPCPPRRPGGGAPGPGPGRSTRRSPDFAWAFASRFMFVLAYAFLTTYQVYYLLDKLGSAEADVPRQIFLGTFAQSVVVVAACLIGGRLSDRTGRRKLFVLTASVVYGLAMFVLAVAGSFNGFLVGMAIGGLGFGVYVAVDLALVVDVLPDEDNAAKDLGVLNIAGALPFPSRRVSRRPSSSSATGATACCSRSPGSGPSSEPSPSCP